MGDQISLVDSIMKLSFVAPYLDDTLAMTLYIQCYPTYGVASYLLIFTCEIVVEIDQFRC